jgi:hypothetical protein
MKISKIQKSTFSLSVSLLALAATLGFATASERPTGDCHPAVWQEVRKLAEDCLALRDDGKNCDALAWNEESGTASFSIRGSEFTAEIVDSEFSDGGDLNDVLMDRDDGCQYELRNVPAYGNLLKALASVETG